MSYLLPQLAARSAEVDMAAIATIGHTFSRLPAQGFRIDIWNLNMDNNSERPTLRLSDGGGLHTTGYDWQRWDKQNAAAYAQEAQLSVTNNTWFDPQGPANTGLVTGYWEGRLADPAQDLWVIHGRFRDDQAVEQARVDIFGQVVLDSPAVGCTVASGNASTWSGGSIAFQSW